jgi:hypothetical protein
MIYELREYTPTPGKLPALNKRFQDHTVELFKKHGMGVVGFWTEEIGNAGTLVYLLSFENLAGREKCWTSFQGDADWQRIRAQTDQEDGPLVAGIKSRIMRPTAYSAMQ